MHLVPPPFFTDIGRGIAHAQPRRCAQALSLSGGPPAAAAAAAAASSSSSSSSSGAAPGPGPGPLVMMDFHLNSYVLNDRLHVMGASTTKLM